MGVAMGVMVDMVDMAVVVTVMAAVEVDLEVVGLVAGLVADREWRVVRFLDFSFRFNRIPSVFTHLFIISP
jgi:hypothetical protein